MSHPGQNRKKNVYRVHPRHTSCEKLQSKIQYPWTTWNSGFTLDWWEGKTRKKDCNTDQCDRLLNNKVFRVVSSRPRKIWRYCLFCTNFALIRETFPEKSRKSTSDPSLLSPLYTYPKKWNSMPTGLPNIYGSIEPENFIFWDQTTGRSCMVTSCQRPGLVRPLSFNSHRLARFLTSWPIGLGS